MLCCAVGVAAIATGAIGWRRLRRLIFERRTAQSLLAAGSVVAIAITIAGLAAEHLQHHAAYVSASETAVLSDPLPLCRGGEPGITSLASIEE